MGRTITDRMADPLWWRDQAAHLTIAFVVSGGTSAALGYGAGLHVAASSALGLLASALAEFTWEAVQNWGDPPETGAQMDSIFDLLAFRIGASLGPLVLLAA